MKHRPTVGRWRRLGVAATAATVALFITSCTATSDEPVSTDANGTGAKDTIVVVTPDQATNVIRDFKYTGGTDNDDVTYNLHAQLIKKPYIDVPADNGHIEDANAQIQNLYEFEPYLADSYEISEDGRTITFNLKSGLLSQQGNELTADDVLWSFERKLKTEGNGLTTNYSPMLTDLNQIQKIDDYTVSFTVEKPGYMYPLMANLADHVGSIMDSDYLKENATPEDPYAVQWSIADLMRGNQGFGAYMIESVIPDQEIVLTANPNYVFGEPEITKIVRRVVPDAATRYNMLVNGDADVALGLRPSDQAELLQKDGYLVPVTTSNKYQHIVLNTQLAPFDDERVRQALAYAMPYDDLINNVWFQRAYDYRHLLDDGLPGYDNSAMTEYEYDPEKAKELLSEAGYPDGVSFTLSLANDIPTDQQSAVLMQQAAAEAGFTIDLQELSSAQMFSDGREGKLQAYTTLGNVVTMSPSNQLSLLTNPGGGSNHSFWSGPEFDEFRAVLQEALDSGDALSEDAVEKYTEAETMFIDAAPYIFFSRVMPTMAFKGDVDGFAQRTDGRIDYSNLTIR